MSVILINSSQWSEFNVVGNEMIIAKVGRPLFPRLVYEFEDLDPEGWYKCQISFILVTGDKLKYVDGKHVSIGQWDKMNDNAINYHISAAIKGDKLMVEGINYSKLKLGNCARPEDAKHEWIHLESQMKYIPVVSLWQVYEGFPDRLVGEYRFEETEFVTVTAYQSKKIIEMKKLNNDYAKSFRADKVDKREAWGEKRKRIEGEESVGKRGKRSKLNRSLGISAEKEGKKEQVKLNYQQQQAMKEVNGQFNMGDMGQQHQWNWRDNMQQQQQQYMDPQQFYQQQYDMGQMDQQHQPYVQLEQLDQQPPQYPLGQQHQMDQQQYMQQHHVYLQQQQPEVQLLQQQQQPENQPPQQQQYMQSPPVLQQPQQQQQQQHYDAPQYPHPDYHYPANFYTNNYH